MSRKETEGLIHDALRATFEESEHLRTGVEARRNIESTLRRELNRLKQNLDTGHELKVVWLPNYDPRLFGEVKGQIIFIYDGEPDKALETLRHEFLDYAISQAIEPYKQVTNKLIMLINEEAYRRKEKLVEALKRTL